MGNDTGFYLGPYVKVGVALSDDFEYYDLIEKLYPKHINGNSFVFVSDDEEIGRRADFIGWDDCGEYGMFLDVESELQNFCETFRADIDTLKLNYNTVEIKWGVVVWGEF